MKIRPLLTLAFVGMSLNAAAEYSPRHVEKCVDSTLKYFGQEKNLILGCQDHSNKYANKCYKSLIFSEAEFHQQMSKVCSYSDNKFAAKIIDEYVNVHQNLNKDTQLLLTHTDTQEEYDCLEDLIGMGSAEKAYLQRCLKDSEESIKKRNQEVFGKTHAVINEVEDQVEDIRDWFNDNFNQ